MLLSVKLVLQNITWMKNTNQKVSNWGYRAKFWMNAGTEARKCVKIIDFQKCGCDAWMSQKCMNFTPNAWSLTGLEILMQNKQTNKQQFWCTRKIRCNRLLLIERTYILFTACYRWNIVFLQHQQTQVLITIAVLPILDHSFELYSYYSVERVGGYLL